MSRWLRPKPRGDGSTEGTKGTKGDTRGTATRLTSPFVPSVPYVETSKATSSPRCAANGPPDIDAFAERAAIREFDGCEKRDAAERAAAAQQGYSDPAALFRAAAFSWRCNLEGLSASLFLAGVADHHVRECLSNARRFIEAGLAEKAAALGWTELELFGVDPSKPWERGDRRGAAYASSAVACITASVIEYYDGQKIWCGQQADGAVLPWEMSAGEAALVAYPHSNIALVR